MSGTIARILKRAVWAPSGDNVQPWRFAISDGTLLNIYNETTADDSMYNHGQRASIMAIGALLENIRLAASAERIGLRVTLFPRDIDDSLIATIAFEGHVEPEPLHEWIERRSSNRRRYDPQPLSNEDRQRLVESVRGIDSVNITIAEGTQKDRIARLASVNERIVLENRAMHAFLFRHITWTPAEDEKHPGFFIDTLELKPPQKFMFWLYSYWPLARMLNAVGFSRVIANENAAIYRSSSAIAALIIPDISKLAYLRAGCALQRLWLVATALGLSAQPLAGIPFLSVYLSETRGKDLSPKHIEMLRAAHDATREALGERSGTIAIMLRIGRAKPPSARTRRAEPNILPT